MAIHIASQVPIHYCVPPMTYEQFASDLPPRRTTRFTSREELEEALVGYGILQPTRQSEKGEFRAALAARSTESVELFADRYSTGLSLHLDVPPATVGILFPRSVSGRFLASGYNLGDDHLLVFPHGKGPDIVGPGPIGSDDILIPESHFLEMMEAVCPPAFLPKKLTVIKVGATRLRRLGDEVVSLIGDPRIELEGERLSNLLASIVSLIGHTSDQWQPEDLNGHGARARVALGAQKFIEGSYRGPVHLQEICRKTGVGVRSLQRCFREYFGFTITDYIKTVRLESSHRELAAADSRADSVTTIALKNGFTHLGRFSVAFHERYGETPSKFLAARTNQKQTRHYPSKNRLHD